jgi:hypothetical protein
MRPWRGSTIALLAALLCHAPRADAATFEGAQRGEAFGAALAAAVARPYW